MTPEVMKLIAAAACMAIGSIGPALGEGSIATKGIEGIGRNPEAADKIFTNMIVSMAVIESIAIFCLVVSLIILFAA
ncbi:MAG: ATP synthase F0 subunit C [Patescibacteria group bacterium]|jgi:F-type H+-transporting ATPase subunit c